MARGWNNRASRLLGIIYIYKRGNSMSQQYDGISIEIEDILDSFEDDNNPLAKEILDRILSLQTSIERKEQERQAKVASVKAQITQKLQIVQAGINTPNAVDKMIKQRTTEPLKRMHTAIGDAITALDEVC